MSDVQVAPAKTNGALVQQTVAIGPSHGLTIDDVQRVGKILAISGYFNDAREMAQAAVKVMAGQELGIPPVASMMGINIIKGKVALGGNLIASRIRAHGYDFKHKLFDNTGCTLIFLGHKGDPDIGHGVLSGRPILGESSFTDEDAKRAEIKSDMYKKYPRNMFFNRAISNGAKWYTPEVFAGAPVYTPEELGAVVDEDGNYVADPIDITTTQQTKTTSTSPKKDEPKAEATKQPGAEAKAKTAGQAMTARFAKLAERFQMDAKEFITKYLQPYWLGYFGMSEVSRLPKDPSLYEAPTATLEAMSETGEETFLNTPTEFGRQVVADAAKKAMAAAQTEQPKTEFGLEGWTPWNDEVIGWARLLVNARNFQNGTEDVRKLVESVGLKSAPQSDIAAFLELSIHVKTSRLAVATAAKRKTDVASIVAEIKAKVGGDFAKAEQHVIDVAVAEVASA